MIWAGKSHSIAIFRCFAFCKGEHTRVLQESNPAATSWCFKSDNSDKNLEKNPIRESWGNCASRRHRSIFVCVHRGRVCGRPHTSAGAGISAFYHGKIATPQERPRRQTHRQPAMQFLCRHRQTRPCNTGSHDRINEQPPCLQTNKVHDF